MFENLTNRAISILQSLDRLRNRSSSLLSSSSLRYFYTCTSAASPESAPQGSLLESGAPSELSYVAEIRQDAFL